MVSEKVRPREPVVVPTASAKSTPVKSPEKKKSKGGIDSEKDPMVKDLSQTFDRVAGDAAGISTAARIDLDDSPMTSTGVRVLAHWNASLATICRCINIFIY